MPPVLDMEAIEHQSQVAPIAEIVEYLQEQLRTPGVVYIAGLQDGKMVGRWKDGIEPQLKTRLRLRHAYHAARIIVEAYDRSTAEAWFFGSNTKLDDEAPARVLRNAQSVDDLRLVVPAAKGFARARQ